MRKKTEIIGSAPDAEKKTTILQGTVIRYI